MQAARPRLHLAQMGALRRHYTKASPDAADIGSFPTQADGSLHTTLLPRVSLVIFQEPQHLLALTYVVGGGGAELCFQGF